VSHSHSHPDLSGRTLGAAVALTLGFVTVEALCGWLGHSLALISDAGHNLADAAALGLSWYALWMANKPSHHGMTYGYHRVGIMAALLNAVSLVFIALLIVLEAVDRLRHPVPVDGRLMIAVATAGIGINGTISVWLHQASRHDLNIRGAYVHMLGDALSAAGVVIAGVLVAAVGKTTADPLASFVIAGLILLSSWGVVTESITVLLEGTPAGTDMIAVIDAVKGVTGVLDVHDLHVWTVGPGVVACSCHVVVAEQSIREGQQVLRAVVSMMERRFRIAHTTVQVEVEGCEPNDMYCTAQRLTRRGTASSPAARS
jgi:cobalt-zinc-cadmium efflux system protein